jgi:signal transduction histidine kinase
MSPSCRPAGPAEEPVLDRDGAASRAELERLAAEQAALRHVATLVAGHAPAEDIFAVVAEEAARHLSADASWISRYEADNSLTILAGWPTGTREDPVGVRASLDGDSTAARVLRRGGPARVVYAGLPGPVAELMRKAGMHSSVGVPIVVDGRVWGVIAASSTGPEQLPAATEERLTAFTELVGTAISNAQARLDLARLAEEQAALRRSATLVARGVPPGEVFAAVVDEIAGLLGDGIAALRRFEADGSSVVIAQRGCDDSSGTEESWEPSVTSPVVVGGRLWGELAAASSDGVAPAEMEQCIADFSELAATAIINAESRAELTASRARVVATADETRRRIERNLHDGVQQRLVSLGLRLGTTASVIPSHLNDFRAELEDAVAALSGVLEDLREVARGIHPAILADGGLGPAVRTLARRSPVPVELNLGVEGRLPEHVEVTAYYVVSELLTNAAKHARASAVRVEISEAGPVLRVFGSDDGVGGADPARGSGLMGLKDRVEAIGGTISLHSPAGTGTSVSVMLPLADQVH